MKLVVIDGQSGRTGALLVERVRAAGLPLELLAVGTNAIATAAMMKAGAQRGATGENPVLVACRDANIIAGPIGILMAVSYTHLIYGVSTSISPSCGVSDRNSSSACR